MGGRGSRSGRAHPLPELDQIFEDGAEALLFDENFELPDDWEPDPAELLELEAALQALVEAELQLGALVNEEQQNEAAINNQEHPANNMPEQLVNIPELKEEDLEEVNVTHQSAVQNDNVQATASESEGDCANVA